MADYILAAHIQVTGGAEAAMQLSQVNTQINNFGAAAKNAGAGGLAGDMDKAAESGGKLRGAMEQVGQAMVRMGTYMGIRLVVDQFREAAQGVLDFDNAMTQSLAIQSGVTDAMRGKMEDLAESISVKLGMAPKDVAEGFYFLASAGLTVDQQMGDLPVVANFARAGMMNLSQATDMLFDSLSALGLKVADPAQQVENLTHLSDLLTVAAIDSMGTVTDFGNALQNKAGAAAKGFGVDLLDTIALLEVFADEGIKGNMAGTTFSALIRDMTGKVQKNGEAWKAMGIEVYDANGMMLPMSDILHSLDTALLPLSDESRRAALGRLGFTLKDMGTIVAVLGRSDQFDQFRAGLETAGGAAQSVAENQMESLRSKLSQFKSMTMVLAIEGFEKLEQVAAWLTATFSPAIASVGDLLGAMGASIGPAAADLGKLAAGATMGGLEALASTIQKITSAVAANPEAVSALSYGIAAIGTSALAAQVAVPVINRIYGEFLLAQGAINSFIVNAQSAFASGGAIGAMKEGWSGLLDVLNKPIMAVLPGALLFAGMIKQFEDAKKASHEFNQQMTKDLDLGTLAGANAGIERYSARLAELQAQNQQNADGSWISKIAKIAGTELDAATPGFFHFTGNLITLKGQLANTKDELGTLTAARDNISTGFDMIGGAINRTGQFASNTVYTFDATTSKMRDLGAGAQLVGGQIDTSAPALERLAAAAHLDISADWHEWAPLLEEAAIKSAAVGDSSGILSQQMLTLADDAATAADKLKAFKDVIGEVFGAPLSKFEAFTQAEQALQKLNDGLAAFKEGGGDINNAFDATTKKGLELRDMLSGGAETAIKYAQSMIPTDGMDAAVAAMETYRARIVGVMTAQGISQPAAEAFADSMGLTAANIAGVKAAAGDGINVPVKAPGLPETKQGITDISGEHKASVTVDVDNNGVATFKVNMEDAAKTRNAQLNVMVDQGGLSQAFTELESMSTPRSVPVTPQVDQGAASQAFFELESMGTPISVPITAAVDSASASQAFFELESLGNPIPAPIVAQSQNVPVVAAEFDQAAADRTALATLNGEWAAAEIGFDTTVQPRTAPATMEGDASAAQGTFDGAVQPRTAPATMAGDSSAAEAGFNAAVIARIAPATMDADWAAAEIGFDTTARHRTSPATQQAETGGAEGALNDTARGRSSTVTASADTGAAEAALNNLTATRNATIAINVAYTSSGAPPGVLSTVGAAEGDVIHAFGYGGFENHTAQIGRAGRSGVTRMWNEPETGGEAYIPLAMSKRDRSLAVWEETGRLLGRSGGGDRHVNVNVPINVSVDGSGDPSLTGQAVASHVKQGVETAMQRLLIELRSA